MTNLTDRLGELRESHNASTACMWANNDQRFCLRHDGVRSTVTESNFCDHAPDDTLTVNLLTAVEAVVEVLSDTPECDVYPNDEPISCGWKGSIVRIRQALTEALIDDIEAGRHHQEGQ